MEAPRASPARVDARWHRRAVLRRGIVGSRECTIRDRLLAAAQPVTSPSAWSRLRARVRSFVALLLAAAAVGACLLAIATTDASAAVAGTIFPLPAPDIYASYAWSVNGEYYLRQTDAHVATIVHVASGASIAQMPAGTTFRDRVADNGAVAYSIFTFSPESQAVYVLTPTSPLPTLVYQAAEHASVSDVRMSQDGSTVAYFSHTAPILHTPGETSLHVYDVGVKADKVVATWSTAGTAGSLHPLQLHWIDATGTNALISYCVLQADVTPPPADQCSYYGLRGSWAGEGIMSLHSPVSERLFSPPGIEPSGYPDSSLISASADGGTLLFQVRAHGQPMLAQYAYRPDTGYVLGPSVDGALCGTPSGNFVGYSHEPVSAAWSADGRYVVCQPDNGDTIYLVDTIRGVATAMETGVHQNTPMCVANDGAHVIFQDQAFRVVEWVRSGAPLGPAACAVVSPGIHPTRMVALGDSYTSGEGLVPENGLRYDCATDLHQGSYFEDTTLPFGFGPTWTSAYCDSRTLTNAPPADLLSRPARSYRNLCHRHARAYPNQIRAALGIAPQNYSFVACSGAIASNVGLVDDPQAQYADSPVHVAGGKTQISTVDPSFTSGGQPDLVTIGLGGNDAGFSKIINQCLGDCLDDAAFVSHSLANINNFVFAQLRQTFRQLHARFPPPKTTIIAFGYPSTVGDPDEPCAAIGVGSKKLSHDELLWLRDQVIPAINRAIEDAASEAGIVYADILQSTIGHELCSDTSQRWINGVRGGDDALGALVGSESFHPNQYAHDAIARYFIDHYTNGAGRLVVADPPPGPPTRTPDDSRVYLGSLSADVSSPCGTQCVQPAQCVPGCQLRLTGTDFGPNSFLDVTLHSDAVDLGTLTADDSGNLAGMVQVPDNTEPGVHAIVLRGAAVDGSPVYATTFVDVMAPGHSAPAGSTNYPASTAPGETLEGSVATGETATPPESARPSTFTGLPSVRRITASVSARWRPGPQRTRVTRMVIHRVPSGATVVLKCATRIHGATIQCGFTARRFYVSSGTKPVSLTRVFRSALATGTRIAISITHAGWIGQRIIFTVRSRRRPTASTLCIPVGSGIPRPRC
jgi:lysophospholipase L1-like esterase